MNTSFSTFPSPPLNTFLLSLDVSFAHPPKAPEPGHGAVLTGEFGVVFPGRSKAAGSLPGSWNAPGAIAALLVKI